MGFKPITFNDSISNNFTDQDEQVYIFNDCIDLNHRDKKNKIFIQLEPQEVCGTRGPLIQNQDYFDLILAWDEETLKNCKNSVLFPFGTAWIRKNELNMNKGNNVSFITSGKYNGPSFDGHAMRHQIWNFLYNYSVPRFNVIKHMSPPFIPNKNFIFETSKFSIVVESVKRNNYFSEKLIDSLVTKTVPIYRGCGNIGNYFNTKGFIMFDTLPELRSILDNLTEEKYEELSEYIKENESIADSYANIWIRVDAIISSYLKKSLRLFNYNKT